MYRRYYSYNDMPVPMTGAKNCAPAPAGEKKAVYAHKGDESRVAKKSLSALDNLKIDDIILIAVIFLLLLDDCDDIFLLLALGFIFIS